MWMPRAVTVTAAAVDDTISTFSAVGIFEFPAMAFVCALVSGRPEANATCPPAPPPTDRTAGRVASSFRTPGLS
jgi:hypothetical protein